MAVRNCITASFAPSGPCFDRPGASPWSTKLGWKISSTTSRFPWSHTSSQNRWRTALFRSSFSPIRTSLSSRRSNSSAVAALSIQAVDPGVEGGKGSVRIAPMPPGVQLEPVRNRADPGNRPLHVAERGLRRPLVLVGHQIADAHQNRLAVALLLVEQQLRPQQLHLLIVVDPQVLVAEADGAGLVVGLRAPGRRPVAGAERRRRVAEDLGRLSNRIEPTTLVVLDVGAAAPARKGRQDETESGGPPHAVLPPSSDATISSALVPSRRPSPGRTTVGAPMRCSLTNVPFVEPRSSTSNLPPSSSDALA